MEAILKRGETMVRKEKAMGIFFFASTNLRQVSKNIFIQLSMEKKAFVNFKSQYGQNKLKFAKWNVYICIQSNIHKTNIIVRALLHVFPLNCTFMIILPILKERTWQLSNLQNHGSLKYQVIQHFSKLKKLL